MAMACRGHGTLDDRRYELLMAIPNHSVSQMDDLLQARREIELLKRADPFNVVEMVIEAQAEKMRVSEMTAARDAAVQRLSKAYESIRQKSAIIERLQQESTIKYPLPSQAASESEILEISEISRLKEEITRLETVIKQLRDQLTASKDHIVPANAKSPDPPPQYDETNLKNHLERLRAGLHSHPFDVTTQPSALKMASATSSQSSLCSASPSLLDSSVSPIPDNFSGYGNIRNTSGLAEPADMVKARNSILATLPLPEEVPDDTLSPISIPATVTLPEFLSSLSGPLRTSLANYRLFYAHTTLWCSEREEHGYLYAPVFKCSTNPRVAAAHRWNAVDVVNRLNKPTESFYNKDGIWYYAGVYKGFRLDDLTTREWAELPPETTQAIVKETITGRKNTSPQNVYEVTQLYAAGALRVACVGLQCVGFNNVMYKALLDQAGTFTQSKWAIATPIAGTGSAGEGLGTGSTWNSKGGITDDRDVVDGMGVLSIGRRIADGIENADMLASRC